MLPGVILGSTAAVTPLTVTLERALNPASAVTSIAFSDASTTFCWYIATGPTVGVPWRG